MKTPKRGRGRPAFQPTAAMRRTVELMVSCGDSKETVARAIGCSVPTLELHFDEELKNGYAKKRREILTWMERGARKGNATLIKRLEEMTRVTGAAADFEAQQKDGASPAPVAGPARAAKRGKKEVQREDAFNAGVNSEWGDDLAPLPGTKPN
ncbi:MULTISPECIES: hypothetical protein [unclassified Mesorhizobium]|uniref:hypothetical protein n=1 Tax=unclassified Mesorhizobium TaxID=325217 RepID=UPI000FCB3C4D|nr:MULTISPECIES: hypothetical protein [unclassified Mesorhizobium]TGP22307.1 hypothetical protein EN874_019535 [Mesorhizobium sp. M1D.F.Ca.ET.231.01.1.1]TGP24723.1 hypothetical protein EN877_30660 [Mesorhizobium sp. M1D.F.Ca.ET.234.01.1.1]TGS37326.1 hypothetical protein EN827_30965 [Mesorhizobium sp. M1D.F.Ca.ET.184.01.1.1]TGS58126.1 hypothetical protein EN826_030940 [Mesorhizobium sp. M1D.F.Ca.ET.183.01.1.1]